MNAVTNHGELSVTGNLTILGPGADQLPIIANDSSRISIWPPARTSDWLLAQTSSLLVDIFCDLL